MSFQQTIQLITSVFPNAETSQDITETSVAESCLSKNYQRLVTQYKNLSQRFKVPCRVYTQQYSELYFYRLQCLKPHLIETCQEKWPIYPVLDTIRSIPSVGELCIVCGIVYKSMRLKPSVLREYIKDLELECPANSYLSDTDQLYLEDETVRIVIAQAENHDKPLCVEKFVTGLVIACLGKRTSLGQFEVQDWTLPGIILPPNIISNSKEPKYIAFLTDLSMGSSLTHYDSLLRVRSFLVGALSTSADISFIASSIVRVIIVGLTCHQNKSDESLFDDTINQNLLNSFTPQISTLQEADAFLYDLACSVNTDLVPGLNDPTNYSLPQNALHPAFFPKSRQLATFQSVTNPYNFKLENRVFLGCAQQGLEDIRNFSSINSNLEALKFCFTAQHLCPTAPDTLPCYPFTQSDPFCLPQKSAEAPNVLFSACHDSLEWEYYNNASSEWSRTNISNSSVLAVCLPSFMKTKQLVLVDLVTFSIKKIQF